MIHHLSLPVRDPRRVAEVFCELFGSGVLTEFGPYRDSWIAWSGDEYGTAVEFYPVGTELYAPEGSDQAQFRHRPGSSGHTATHAAISVELDVPQILEVADREGWRALVLPRGGFDVVEFWIDNAVMVELMTPTMTRDYLAIVPRPRAPLED